MKNLKGITAIETAGVLAVLSVPVLVAFLAFGQFFANTADEDADGIRDGVIPGLMDTITQTLGEGLSEAETEEVVTP
ncbi:hypothetical protein [Citreimonas salinaria]|uniref:Uncharacterized protein n=1 Tax=Citreimonas salinaria TaxID=321339 RepID=A0A1H3LZP6_9RHOB|nr:hypothetical protein [Citreimonas salinaria]SDY69488.1 hypothetical protein SAMN05444340_1151 [Citreimonas salinaria]